MIKGLLRKIGLGGIAAEVVDTVVEEVADRATGGIAGDVVEIVEKRKARKKKKATR